MPLGDKLVLRTYKEKREDQERVIKRNSRSRTVAQRDQTRGAVGHAGGSFTIASASASGSERRERMSKLIVD